MLEKREFDKSDFMWRVSAMVALTSGILSVIFFTLLMVHYVQLQIDNPVDNEDLPRLRALYASLPEEDPALAERIQYLDLLTRRAIFTSQTTLNMGGVMLLVSVCVFLYSLLNMTRWSTEKPELAEKPQAEIEWEAVQISRPYLIWTGVGLLIVGLGASFLSQQRMRALEAGAQIVAKADETAAGGGAVAAADLEFPEWEALQTQWPSFRGPGGLGVAHFTNAPDTWDVEAGTGVKWKVKVPLEGSNSPVIWDDRLYLAGADDTKREIYCYDTNTGELRWTHTLSRYPGTPPEVPDVTDHVTQAPSTMVVHGEIAYALYANGDLAAVDSEGQLLWGKSLGLADDHYGHSSSLIAYGDKLLVQYDDNANPRLIVLNAADGNEAATVERSSISWASPALADTERGVELLLASSEDAAGYDPLTGTLRWLQEWKGGEVGPSPAFGAGMVLVANEYADATAIKLNTTDEVTTPEIVWQYDYMLPEMASPVSDGEHFYLATSVGEMVCLRASDGEELWVEEMGYGFISSPILVGDKLYGMDIEGKMFIARAGAEAEVLAEIPFDEETVATPAFMDGRIYVRTVEHLLCIERPNPEINGTVSSGTMDSTPIVQAGATPLYSQKFSPETAPLAEAESLDGSTNVRTAENELRIERSNAANS